MTDPSSDLTQDTGTSPFYRELRATLGNPVFMCDGGVLGVASHHKYVYSDLNDAELLAGAIEAILKTAREISSLQATTFEDLPTAKKVLARIQEVQPEDGSS